VVAAFVNYHLNPLGRQVAKAQYSSHAILEFDPLQKSLLNTDWQLPIEFNDVGLLETKGRMGGSKGQISIICEQDQPFGIPIEATYMK
jgi:hypothetical protein